MYRILSTVWMLLCQEVWASPPHERGPSCHGNANTNTWTMISNSTHTAFGMRCHKYSRSGERIGSIQVLRNNRTDIAASPEMSCERTISNSVRVARRRAGESCNRMIIQLTINHRSHLRSSVVLGSVAFSSLDPSSTSLGEL